MKTTPTHTPLETHTPSNTVAAHTPGPWTVDPFLTPEAEDDSQGVYKVEPAFTKLTQAYFNAPFCQEDTSELDAVHAENAANARLIAAAPELLEALTEARDYVVKAYECAFPDAAENDAVLGRVDAAIARATRP
jgi:hypothetical protein